MKHLIFTLLAASMTAIGSIAVDIKWHSADNLPLLGKGIDDASTVNRYQRLPDSLESKVSRPDLYFLGTHTSGMAIRFKSNSPSIHARWKSRHKFDMNHMTATGVRGLDLYALQGDSTWTFVNSARPNSASATTTSCIIGNMDPTMREYMLYLSLYDGIDSLEIGIENSYKLLPPTVDLPSRKGGRIVFYGTSILQGGCANRPAMSHANILQRRLNREIVNYGFSGNGQLDLEIADIVASVPDVAMYILDFVPNVNEEQIKTRMIPFVEKLEKAHPGVPILFVEDPNFPHKRFDKVVRHEVDTRNELMKSYYEQLAARFPNFYYLPATDILGHDNEATVDGVHFTDLGFTRYADLLAPIITRILQPK